MSDERVIGEHDARLGNLEDAVKEIKGDVKQILLHISENKGSWKTLSALGGGSGIIATLITEWFIRRS